MTPRKDTIWERFLKPVFQLVVDEEPLRKLYESIDWEKQGDRFSLPNLVYPQYYSSQNFHGIERGYLNPGAAVTYDPVTQYALPPNETWVRQGLIDAIAPALPARILDLGCGTGSTTLMLKQAFPEAEVIGLDLSPYMLVMADYKAQQARLNIHWVHGNAEATAYADASFDLVTASLLLHETPPVVSQSILQECFRLLIPGGQVVILDGNQKILRHTEWLTDIFEEPYIKAYAAESVDSWMGAAGFEAVHTEDLWLVNQVSRGLKPMLVKQSPFSNTAEVEDFDLQEVPFPAF